MPAMRAQQLKPRPAGGAEQLMVSFSSKGNKKVCVDDACGVQLLHVNCQYTRENITW